MLNDYFIKLQEKDLKNHMTSHHKETETNFECEFCQRRYANKTNLNKHTIKCHQHEYLEQEEEV